MSKCNLIFCSLLVLITCMCELKAGPVSLNEHQQQKLVQLINDNAEVGKRFKQIKSEADAALQDQPDPIHVTLFEPKNSRHTLELAAYFDPSLNPLILKLYDDAGQYPSWEMVLNAVRRHQ